MKSDQPRSSMIPLHVLTQIVGASQWMNATFEVSVSRKNSATDQAILLDGGRDALVQRSRVTNASHTTVAGDIEAEFLQASNYTRLAQVVGDDTRSRRQRCLDVGSNVESEFHGVSCQQTSAEHDTWVRGVCTRSHWC